jgi:hypothetical protein
MNDAAEEVDGRKQTLIKEILGEASKHHRAAILNEWLLSGSFYFSLLFGGLAVLFGFVKSAYILPEYISVCAAIGTGLSFLSKEAKYRAKADWNFWVRDTASQLVQKLRYEMPIPTTRGDVAAISEEWRRKRSELGIRMSEINRSPTQSQSASPPQKS